MSVTEKVPRTATRLSFKDSLKSALPVQWHARMRSLGRLRMITKLRVLAYSDVTLRDVRWEHVRYVLWDPEVESHTYDVANVDELAEFLADLLGCDVGTARRYLDEGVRDVEFDERWRSRLGRRLDLKSRAMLGNRLLWWGLVRILKPALCVECGVYNGLGSLVLLRALELNTEEGHPGELMSVDADPASGWVVPPRLADRWELIEGTTADVLGPTLLGRRVDLLVHDTPHTAENAEHEFGLALSHRAARTVLLDSSGGRTGVLQRLCEEQGGRYARFVDVPSNHFRRGSGTGVGLFTEPEAPC
ncbi:methyltransferase family protein [Actinomycetospora succinea]|uniref:Methyltransferase family protein n=2 Tax=Actinomycetospora succinea TaxID=663603 RepID=A0A4R6UPN8_9PSEU|nr:methyltransferase family protein [Actinomycetospora succinea]